MNGIFKIFFIRFILHLLIWNLNFNIDENLCNWGPLNWGTPWDSPSNFAFKIPANWGVKLKGERLLFGSLNRGVYPSEKGPQHFRTNCQPYFCSIFLFSASFVKTCFWCAIHQFECYFTSGSIQTCIKLQDFVNFIIIRSLFLNLLYNQKGIGTQEWKTLYLKSESQLNKFIHRPFEVETSFTFLAKFQ